MLGRVFFHHHAAVRALHVLIGFGYVEGAVKFRANPVRLFHEDGQIELVSHLASRL